MSVLYALLLLICGILTLVTGFYAFVIARDAWRHRDAEVLGLSLLMAVLSLTMLATGIVVVGVMRGHQ